MKIKICDPSVLNFKQSKIFKKFLDNPEQAKSIFKILTRKLRNYCILVIEKRKSVVLVRGSKKWEGGGIKFSS